jgi:hypothetical protein
MRPYQDLEQQNDFVIRKFDQNIDPIELKWHMDNESRIVEVLECGPGWKFQYDNKLPQDLKPKTILNIQRHEYHRVIKGEGNLLIKIHKIKD